MMQEALRRVLAPAAGCWQNLIVDGGGRTTVDLQLQEVVSDGITTVSDDWESHCRPRSLASSRADQHCNLGVAVAHNAHKLGAASAVFDHGSTCAAMWPERQPWHGISYGRHTFSASSGWQ